MKNAKAWENADNQFTINLLDMHLIGCLAELEFSRLDLKVPVACFASFITISFCSRITRNGPRLIQMLLAAYHPCHQTLR